jgi:hypothetical protein
MIERFIPKETCQSGPRLPPGGRSRTKVALFAKLTVAASVRI